MVYFGKIITKQGNKPEMEICDVIPTLYCISVTVCNTTKLFYTSISKIKSILLVWHVNIFYCLKLMKLPLKKSTLWRQSIFEKIAPQNVELTLINNLTWFTLIIKKVRWPPAIPPPPRLRVLKKSPGYIGLRGPIFPNPIHRRQQLDILKYKQMYIEDK